MDDPKASTFLKAFGSFHVATLETKEVSTNQLVLDEIKELRTELAAMYRSQQPLPTSDSPFLSDEQLFDLLGTGDARAVWKGMQKAREERLANELRHMKLPVKRTGPENKTPDLEQEHTKSNDEKNVGGL
jgi:hypothetical protein